MSHQSSQLELSSVTEMAWALCGPGEEESFDQQQAHWFSC